MPLSAAHSARCRQSACRPCTERMCRYCPAACQKSLTISVGKAAVFCALIIASCRAVSAGLMSHSCTAASSAAQTAARGRRRRVSPAKAASVSRSYTGQNSRPPERKTENSLMRDGGSGRTASVAPLAVMTLLTAKPVSTQQTRQSAQCRRTAANMCRRAAVSVIGRAANTPRPR